MQTGIIIPALYSQQILYEAILAISNNLSFEKDYIIFFEDYSPVMMRIPCAVMHISEIHSFHGKLISTTLTNTEISLNSKNKAKKIFYIWNLEWLHNSKDYFRNIKIYQDPNITLYTRSNSYAEELNNYANIKPIVTDLENVICMKNFMDQ